jgi:hypothetical protein
MIKGAFCVVVAISITSTSAYCQRPVDTTAYGRHTVFVSALGQGLVYSFNYDYRWRMGRGWMSLSAGFAFVNEPGWHLYEEDQWTASIKRISYPNERINGALYSIPIQWNWFFGRTHHREHGAGLTFGHAWWAEPGRDGYSEQPDILSNALCISVKPIAYRFQKAYGGIYFRIYPMVHIKAAEFNADWRKHLKDINASEHPIIPSVGLDLGYTMPPKHQLRKARN